MSASNSASAPKRQRASTQPDLIGVPNPSDSRQYVFINNKHNVPSTPPFASPDSFRDVNLNTPEVNENIEKPTLYAEIDARTHENRLSLQAQMTSGKGTEIAYPRQVKAYETYWEVEGAARRNEDPDCEVISAQPITATKVAAYLAYASRRCKRNRDGVEIIGTTLGWESIKQIVSALESHRKSHQHKDIYRRCLEAQKPLRNDERIQIYEKAAKATDAQRLADSHRIKALGAVNDTYTDDELIRASMFFIRNTGKSPRQVHTGIRDRTMLLISTTTAYRGDNTRRLTWSDIRLRSVPLLDIGPDRKETALVFLSNQGKTNTQGRIDEQAALRHRIPELCVFGALGFYFFSYFHLLGNPPPDFSPIFTNPGADELGAHPWYNLRLFPGANGETSEMSYETHRKRVNNMKVQMGIAISKVTHAGRPYAAITAREHRASRDDTKDLGGWSQSGSYHVYDQTLPVGAMLGAASFNAHKQETYMIARNVLVPPTELVTKLFPWVEDEEKKRQDRRQLHGKNAEDNALKNLLEVLIHFRSIILQDAAVLFTKYPDSPLFSSPPFNSLSFRTWAAASTQAVYHAEEQSRLQLQSFPDHVIASMRGVFTEANIQSQQSLQGLFHSQSNMQGQLDRFNTLLEAVLPQPRSRRASCRSTRPSTTTTPAATLSVPIPVATPVASTSVHHLGVPGPTEPLVASVSLGAPAIAQTISRQGHIYVSHVFPLSTDPFEREQQLDSIDYLESKLPVERLRKHTFDWIRASKEWLPRYRWWTSSVPSRPLMIEQIWAENEHGLDGQLSVRELTTIWMARWKRNEPRMKSEGTRRGKVISLINALAAKPNWNASIALRFLKDKYPIPTRTIPYLKTTRAFIDHLQKKDGSLYQEVMTAAQTYCS